MSSNDSKSEEIQLQFEVLSEVASLLNSASDELSKVVGSLDDSLKKLNIGLTVWVNSRSGGDNNEPDAYDDDQLGYSKVNGKWGIALRRIWGNPTFGIDNEDGPWLFNDAPREMRLASVDKIPDLVKALGRQAFDTAKKVQQKTEEVRELVGAIEKISKAEKQTTKPPPLVPTSPAKTVPLNSLLGKSKVGAS